jgi:hypothetical protein
MPNAKDTMSINQQALTPTVRTRQCGHIVWGKKGASPISDCAAKFVVKELTSPAEA